MKTPSTRIAPVTNWIPRLAPAAARGIETSQPMKTRLIKLKFLIILFSTVATTAVFSQSSYVWTNQAPLLLAAGDMNQATNWLRLTTGTGGTDAGGVPRPDFQDGLTWGDEMLFDGLTTGPLAVTQNGGSQANGAGSGQPYGLRIHLSANQTAPVTLQSAVSVSGGMRMNYFAIDAGSGGLNVGDHSVNCLDIVGGVLNGQVFGFTNNSTVPAVINETVRWRMGGAGAHPYIFDGTGDWIVNNRLRSANSSAILVQKEGPGTLTWTATNTANANAPDGLGTPIRINGGTMIWKSSDIVGGSAGNPGLVHNGILFRYDAPVGSGLILGAISGAGPIQMNAGTLTLSGQNTISGDWTLSGGTLIAGSTEVVGINGPLGLGGTISFGGGTLTYSANNAYDYSSRFSTAAGQAISVDTAGQLVTYAANLTSSGGSLTKLGNGELTLTGANTYNGLTTVSGGTLNLQGANTGSGGITVADGATLGIFDAGTAVTPATLTVGTSLGANLQFDNVTNQTSAPLIATTIASAGTISIGLSSELLSAGKSYPLISWSGGAAPAVSLGIVEGGGGFLTTNGNSIKFNCTSVALVWSGAADANWNSSAINWTVEGVPINYTDPKQVVFNDNSTANPSVAISGVVQPESVTVNNINTNYTITSSAGNIIGGSVRLGKKGIGTLTLSGGANTNLGVTTLKGGTLIVSTLANGGVASDLGAASSAGTNLVLNGGTLQYTGGAASINRLFNLGTSGGTIANEGTGPLTLNNPGAITLSGILTLSGSTADTNTLAAGMIGGGSVTKSGTGTWILTGTNTYGGGTVVANGVLQVGANGGTGSLGLGGASIGAGAAIDFLRTGTVTVSGPVIGNGAVSQSGSGTTILANNNSYVGGTTINAGTLQVGSGGGNGSLFTSGAIVNNSLLDFNTAGSFTYGSGANGIISGTGNVIVRGGGFIKAIGNNTYTGWTRIDANTTFQPAEGQDGLLASSAITNNGTLRLVRQDALFSYPGPIVGTGRVQIGANNVNVGQITFTGTNTYTGGTFIGDNELILGDAANAGAGALAGNVQFVNNFTIAQDNPRTLTFNRPDDFTFGGTITTNFTTAQANLGVVQQNGAGILTLTGNNTYGSGTVVNGGTLQVGNGGGSGSLGSGPVTLNTQLIFNRTGNLTVGTVTGAGTLVKRGTGTVTLTGASSAGAVVLEAGTLGAAPSGAIGSLTVAGDLTIVAGSTVLAGLDRSLSPSNSVFNAGSITHTNGGILRLINGGPALQVGDKFSIFNQLVPGGASMTIVSPGFSVQNDLAVDGSVTVTGVLPAPTITATVTGGTTLNLSWPSAWAGGVLVQVQTNTIAVGLANNWFTIPGTDAGNTYSAPIVRTNGAVFYRLINP
jgi:fibronectin-binding autotransporter adhesin